MKHPKESDIRCRSCGRLLARGRIEEGEIELFCQRCKAHRVLRATRPNSEPHDGLSGDRHAIHPPLHT